MPSFLSHRGKAKITRSPESIVFDSHNFLKPFVPRETDRQIRIPGVFQIGFNRYPAVSVTHVGLHQRTVNLTMTTPDLIGRWDKTGTNQIIDSPVSIAPRDIVRRMTSSTIISVLAGTYIVTIAAVVINFFLNDDMQRYKSEHKYIHRHMPNTIQGCCSLFLSVYLVSWRMQQLEGSIYVAFATSLTIRDKHAPKIQID